MPETIRPTKKQRELLEFISSFIAEHGYSPSYREIMNGLNYTSVATVAAHVNNLIRRGHLVKRDHSARSLEVIGVKNDAPVTTKSGGQGVEWLHRQVEEAFERLETAATATQRQIDELYVLVGALKVLDQGQFSKTHVSRLRKLAGQLKTGNK